MTEPDWAALEAAWQPARKAGVLGSSTIAELVAHAAGFLPAACRVHDEFLGIDLGTGAGVPGVLLALARPSSRWVLVDSSKRRCALAAQAVAAVGLEERVAVRHMRAEDLGRELDIRGCADLVVARSFGSPPEVAECGLALLRPGGQLVVSVTEATERRWREADSSGLEFRVESTRESDHGRFIEVNPVGVVPERFPRRPAARRRRPLF